MLDGSIPQAARNFIGARYGRLFFSYNTGLDIAMAKNEKPNVSWVLIQAGFRFPSIDRNVGKRDHLDRRPGIRNRAWSTSNTWITPKK